MPFQTRLNSDEHFKKGTVRIKTNNKRLKRQSFQIISHLNEKTVVTVPKAFSYLIQTQLENQGKGFNKELYAYC